MRFHQISNESLASALPYQQRVGKHLKADDPETKYYRFNINDVIYDVHFKSDNMGKDWQFIFTARTPKTGVHFDKTGTGSQQQVFASVINILRDFIKKVQPDSITFSADKSEGNRVSLYQAMARRFRPELQRLGYTIGSAGGNYDYDFANFVIKKINEEPQLVKENKFDFEGGDCPIFAIALHKLSGLPLYGLVEYIEEMDDWALIHAYVKTADGKAIDINGTTTVKNILDTFPREGYEDPQEVKFTEQKLLKIGYGKNKCPTLQQVLPQAKKVLLKVGFTKINKKDLNELKKYSHTGQGYRDRFPSVIDREAWRGPHEGRELDMMLDNKKPAALITSISWPLFKPYIKKHRFIGRPMQGYMKGFYLVAQPDEQWRLNKIEQIMTSFHLDGGNLDRYHAKLGRLLGYDKEQIKKFINLG